MASFLCEAKKPNKQKNSVVFLAQGSRPALDGGGRSGPTLEGRKKEGSGGGKNNTTVTGQPGSSPELQNPTDLNGRCFPPKAVQILSNSGISGVQFMGLPHVYCMYALVWLTSVARSVAAAPQHFNQP